MVVIGDSISDQAFYASKKGNQANTIWWAKLGRKTKLNPVVFALRSSGYTHSKTCGFDTFENRIASNASLLSDAEVVIIAGGVNDYNSCSANRHLIPATQIVIDQVVNQTLNTLDNAVQHNGRVIITAPWGTDPVRKGHRQMVSAALRQGAAQRGFQYVDTTYGVLTKSSTTDKVHPNKKGSQALFLKIYWGTDLRYRFR